jgi:hypothetical protein
MDGEASFPTRWRVRCPIHGQVYLTEREYDRQIMCGHKAWACPRVDVDPNRFGLCGEESDFDVDHLEASL